MCIKNTIYSCPVLQVVLTVVIFSGYVNYTVNVVGSDSHIDVQILDTHGKPVANTTGTNATLNIAGVQLWWPYTMMTENFGYLYTLQVILS